MIETLFELLGTFYQRRDFAQAESIARCILQAIPDDVVSLQFLGLVLYRTSRRDEARRAFSAADGSERCPHGHEDSELRASAQCLRAASGPTLAGAWYDLGLVLFRQKRYQQAISALQAAISARPDFRAAQCAIQRITRFSGRQRRAAKRELHNGPIDRIDWGSAGSVISFSRAADVPPCSAHHHVRTHIVSPASVGGLTCRLVDRRCGPACMAKLA